ncbi:hypothetical protein NL436_28160, partial [Klebsiella pneumoniae]|nr:hypothetical protein [Klebsiella pneumoniae]
EWLLRASGGFSARANSALLVGEPGVPWDSAVAEAVGFYASRGLLPRAQVVAGSATEERLREAGWSPSPGYEVPVSFLLAG